MSELWDRFLTDTDVEVFAASGYGQPRGLRTPMALLVVDVTYAFTGDPGLGLLASIDKFPNSCGPAAWRAVHALETVLPLVRALAIPIIYTTGSPDDAWLATRTWQEKQTRTPADIVRANQIVEPIRPQPTDTVIRKTAPSAFFDTPLRQYLVAHGTQQVVVCGGSTSGCVRATVVDAFSHGYRVAVLADATFDRGEASHAVSLFDMQQKYADLVSVEEFLGSVDRK
jgi:maleamate amidohydrolase